MPGKTKKATFSLRTDVLAELDEVMSKGIAPSKNALVEQALLKELKELRRQERQRIWQEEQRILYYLKILKTLRLLSVPQMPKLHRG